MNYTHERSLSLMNLAFRERRQSYYHFELLSEYFIINSGGNTSHDKI